MIGAIGQVGRIGLSPQRGSLLLYPNYVQDYLDRVTAADVAAGNTSGLDRGVTDAFSTALQALVADTYLGISGNVISQSASTIKAACFMLGANTLSGSLVPVVGPAPTNFNFVGNDYNRKTGNNSDGIGKYLDTNYAGSADPPDDTHCSVRVSSVVNTGSIKHYLAHNDFFDTGSTAISAFFDTGAITFKSRNAGAGASLGTNTSLQTGFLGLSRSSSTQFNVRGDSLSSTITNTSQTPATRNYFVFARSNFNNVPGNLINARIAAYTIGRSLDLSILRTRMDALYAAIAAAIP